jgi:hypothetical protein
MYNIYKNMFLYHSKGITSYFINLNIDEYIIPSYPYTNIYDILHASNNNNNNNHNHIISSNGYTNNDCTVLKLSEYIIHKNRKFSSIFSREIPWIGSKFINSPELSSMANINSPKFNIIKTNHVLYIHVDNGYNDNICNKFTLENIISNNQYGNITSISSSSHTNSLAIIYKFTILTDNSKVSSSQDDSINDYIQRYYNNVILHLRKRGIELLVTIPHLIPSPPNPVEKWIKFRTIYPGKVPEAERNAIIELALKNL